MRHALHRSLPFDAPNSSDGSVSLKIFISKVQEFLDEHLTPDLRKSGQETTGVHSEIAACRIWHRRLYEKGWIAPAWPVAHGGTGWDSTCRFVFEQECARNDAPVLFASGLRSIGPLLIAAGTPEQKLRYLPRILSGDDLWCQGFSEANAGSDLAALSMRAVARGGAYVVTGRKLWTTGAHLSNRMFALVRTQSGDKPQRGITFLLIDMDLPGIEVRPLVTIDGQHEFNEVIFNDVEVQASDRVGAENEGWALAKHLMRLARSNNTNASLLRRTWRVLERMVARQSFTGSGLEYRIAALEAELAAFESLELNYLGAGLLRGDDDTASSTMKLAATDLHQRITELLMDAAGPIAGVDPGLRDGGQDGVAAGSFCARKYLATRAASIYSGTNEIHRNVIARQLVGVD